ncbi:uncharacterized protein LOC132748106 [Ruditapes philippinarum]|uniref:uncharacterized protein LOC132748106 n=1 Tax=Ruditapes philippinarum TaxID=129788 RepID=UPI00295AC1A4|nr:uncharacterized protein LOC132748106 [Ruditapes philippinarum]
MCQSGHCVESPLAPPVDDEACPFGDTPYIVPYKKLSCSDLLGSPATTYNCYIESTRQHCCATCEAIKKSNTAYKDCDYGDKKSTCVGMSLQLCRNNFEVCCKTCQDIRLDIPGCPWGDEYTDCTQSHCTNDFSKCCQTCAATNTALTTAATSTSKPLPTAATCTKATDSPSATGTDTTTTTSEPVARISTTNTLIILNFIIHHVIIGLFIGI